MHWGRVCLGPHLTHSLYLKAELRADLGQVEVAGGAAGWEGGSHVEWRRRPQEEAQHCTEVQKQK